MTPRKKIGNCTCDILTVAKIGLKITPSSPQKNDSSRFLIRLCSAGADQEL